MTINMTDKAYKTVKWITGAIAILTFAGGVTWGSVSFIVTTEQLQSKSEAWDKSIEELTRIATRLEQNTVETSRRIERIETKHDRLDDRLHAMTLELRRINGYRTPSHDRND